MFIRSHVCTFNHDQRTSFQSCFTAHSPRHTRKYRKYYWRIRQAKSKTSPAITVQNNNKWCTCWIESHAFPCACHRKWVWPKNFRRASRADYSICPPFFRILPTRLTPIDHYSTWTMLYTYRPVQYLDYAIHLQTSTVLGLYRMTIDQYSTRAILYAYRPVQYLGYTVRLQITAANWTVLYAYRPVHYSDYTICL